MKAASARYGWGLIGAAPLALFMAACEGDSDGPTSAERAQARLLPRIDWSMEPRCFLDVNHNGLVDQPNTPQYVFGLPADTERIERSVVVGRPPGGQVRG